MIQTGVSCSVSRVCKLDSSHYPLLCQVSMCRAQPAQQFVVTLNGSICHGGLVGVIVQKQSGKIPISCAHQFLLFLSSLLHLNENYNIINVLLNIRQFPSHWKQEFQNPWLGLQPGNKLSYLQYIPLGLLIYTIFPSIVCGTL